MAKTKVLICPYCGETQPPSERCRACAGLFEPLSRQATHNAMGPWFIRDRDRPFAPGCSYETLVQLIERGTVTKFSIIRGPTTTQFWTVAWRVPGIAHLFGHCHECGTKVGIGAYGCSSCGAPFGAYLDRDGLGLPEVRPLPWEAPDHRVERSAPRPSRGFRLSSFATDEELRGGGSIAGAPPAAVDPAASTGTAVASRAAPAEPATAPQSNGHADDRALVRELRRRVERQARTVRVLTFLVAALALVAAALTLMQFIPRTGPLPAVGRAPETVAPAPAVIAPDVEPARVRDDGAGDDAGATEAGPDNLADDAPDAGAAPVDDLEDAAAPLALVERLIEQGEDPARARDERRAAFAQAADILDNLEVDLAGDERPVEAITALRDRLERGLERLELEQAFPG